MAGRHVDEEDAEPDHARPQPRDIDVQRKVQVPGLSATAFGSAPLILLGPAVTSMPVMPAMARSLRLKSSYLLHAPATCRPRCKVFIQCCSAMSHRGALGGPGGRAVADQREQRRGLYQQQGQVQRQRQERKVQGRTPAGPSPDAPHVRRPPEVACARVERLSVLWTLRVQEHKVRAY